MAKLKSNLSNYGVIPLAATAAGFVVATALSIVLVQGTVNSDHRQILGEKLAGEIAQQVNIKENHFCSQLKKIASSSIVTTAITGSTASIIETESTLAGVIPFAERVRLIKPGTAKTDQGFPPFNYTALDLVKSAETGGSTHPEAISSRPQLEGDKWIIVATPIKSTDNSIMGTLFVYLSTSALSQAVTDGTKGQAHITEEALEDIKGSFKELLQEVQADLDFA